jgi:glutamine amidotransferase
VKVAIIKYNAGNVQSVAFALDRLGITPIISNIPEEIEQADKVIFPGVGEAQSTMNYLIEHNLDKLIPTLKQPVLGICLGMQLMCSFSEENNTTCLGVFEETVLRFKPVNHEKIPHMGWNQIHHVNNWPDDTLENKSVYFVHSYYVPVNVHTTAITDYSMPFSAAMKKNNFYAVQFHPEKSAEVGAIIFKSFFSL